MHHGSALIRWVHVRWLMTALGSALVFLVLIDLRQAGYLEGFELATYDAFLRLQSQKSKDAPIVIIGVTEKEIQELREWPLTDETLAEALQILASYEPRVIGVDIYRDIPIPPGSQELENVLREHDEIIVVEKAPSANRIGIPAPTLLNDSMRVGFNDVVPDPAGVVRRALLFMDYGSSTAYSFGLRLALRYLEAGGIVPEPGIPDPAYLRLGSTTLPPLEADHGGYVNIDASGYQILLDFDGGPQPFSTYSLTDLRSGKIGRRSLRDKIVLLGVTSDSVKDVFYTPYDTGRNREGIPGIVLHAHVANQLLMAGRQKIAPRRSLNKVPETLWIFIWCMLGGLFAMTVRSASTFGALAATGLIALTGIVYAGFTAGWWIPFVPPAVGWIASSALTAAYLYSQERWERGLLMQIFSKNVSREAAETIWKQRELILEGGRIRSDTLTATVLFSDIQGFTSICERLDPQTLTDWLNKYMASMTRLVMEHRGMVDDYAGDGIKANFGVPLARTTATAIRQDARNAVSCALSMRSELQNLNAIWQKNGLPAVRIRIGINTGIVVAGTLGSAERIKYTTVGDAVNVAARLEGLQVSSGNPGVPPDELCRILVSEETLRYLGETFQAKYLGSFAVKGREQSVYAYLIMDESVVRNATPEEEEQSCTTPVSR